MSYQFTAASSQYLTNTTTGLTAARPITIAAWGYANSLTAQMCLASSNEFASPYHRISIVVNTNGTIQLAHSGSANTTATTTAAISTGAWFHAAGIVRGNTDRSVYLNGGNRINNTTNVATTNVPTRTIVGARYTGSFITFFDGYLAEVGVWNTGLTDSEILALYQGFSPRQIRPQNLTFYAPLRGLLVDIEGGRTLTATGAAAATLHPAAYP